MIVGLDKPVGEENINEPGGMEKFVRSRPILVALDLMPAKKQVMSNRFKLASGVCEVQADGFVIFVMIIS